MKRTQKNKRIKRLLRFIYLKLFRINDTPARIALGLGLGVFLGILPGTGPLAALFLAFILPVNRASALLGSLITNTWLSLLTFIFAVKAGSYIMGLKWQEVYTEWVLFLKHFRLPDLFKITALKVILPVILGYILVALLIGIVVYLITLVILKNTKHENKSRADFSR